MVLRKLVFVFIALMVLWGHQSFSQQIQLIQDEQSPHYGSLLVEYKQILDSLQITGPAEAHLKVFVTYDDSPKNLPPMLGSTYQMPKYWVFKPRFPFELDQLYRAEFTVDSTTVQTYFKPAVWVSGVQVPQVVNVLPGDSILPANLLRLYINFSQPMTRHDAYSYIHLLNHQGDTLNQVFYPAEPPLWDKSGQQLTLLFDPGRIKSGLQPNLQWGPGLKPHKEYQLLVSGMEDFRGTTLSEVFKFNFRTGATDHISPNVQSWQIQEPKVGTKEPLIVKLDEPVNHAQVEKAFQIIKDNQSIPVLVSTNTDLLEISPTLPWLPGSYHLRVFNTLEDLAGNSLRKPFEVKEAKNHPSPMEWIDIPFHIANEKP
jgi:hypothetical protein